MMFAQKLQNQACNHCGDEELIWWTEDETETTVELYMTCDSCGYEYPKKFVKKSDDTSDPAMKERLKSML